MLTLTESELKNLKLTEGLIRSADRVEFVTRVTKAFPNLLLQWDKKVTPFLIIFGWYEGELSPEKEKRLTQLFNTLGWYEAQRTSFSHRGRNGTQVVVEPKYDIFQEKLPTRLYHVTPVNTIDKILKIGLSPKSKSRTGYHPARVYVAVSKTAAVNIASQFHSQDGKKYALLEIDTGKLLKMTKFFWDKNFTTVPHGGTPLGLYTLSNIPPQALTRLDYTG
jgi:hypothetical protein